MNSHDRYVLEKIHLASESLFAAAKLMFNAPESDNPKAASSQSEFTANELASLNFALNIAISSHVCDGELTEQLHKVKDKVLNELKKLAIRSATR